MMRNYLPHCCVGPIVKGFGRGSKDLGCPTGNLNIHWTGEQSIPIVNCPISDLSANFALDVVQKLPADIETGVYFGWAKVDDGNVHKAVLSIGWNPFYGNNEKSVVSSIQLNSDSPLFCTCLPRKLTSRFCVLYFVMIATSAIQVFQLIKFIIWTGNPYFARVRRRFVWQNSEIVHLRLLATREKLRLTGFTDCGHSEGHQRCERFSGHRTILRSSWSWDFQGRCIQVKAKWMRYNNEFYTSIYLTYNILRKQRESPSIYAISMPAHEANALSSKRNLCDKWSPIKLDNFQ